MDVVCHFFSFYARGASRVLRNIRERCKRLGVDLGNMLPEVQAFWCE